MLNQYLEFGKVIEKRLVAAGFTAKPEFVSGMGRVMHFEKGDNKINFSYDIREQTFFIQYFSMDKFVASEQASDLSNASGKFLAKLNEWLDPAFVSSVPSKQKKGFLAALFGIQ